MVQYSLPYWLYWIVFKIFEIILFLLPAFPPNLWMRIVVLVIYVIGHICGVQTYYKEIKCNILEKETNSTENSEKKVLIPSSIE